jgi:hypothetical protein
MGRREIGWSRTVLSNMVASTHVWVYEFKLSQRQCKIQFLSDISHISNGSIAMLQAEPSKSKIQNF